MPVGKVLADRYHVVRNLASGGMGAVHEARDLRLANTPCAIKEILGHRLQGPDATYMRSRFAAEMEVLARLEHPGIPRIRDYFSQDLCFYIVMDYVDGDSLDRELTRTMEVTGRPLRPEVVAADMLQVLDILSYLHEHQPPILHRDVKPANLVRESRTGRLKLVDFGLARTTGAESQTMVGTPGYCPLEQLAGHAEPRSDLYAVGVTMHQLVTGQSPRGLSLAPLEAVMPDYQSGLAAILERATRTRVEERFPSCRLMARELKDWLAEQSGDVAKVAVQGPVSTLPEAFPGCPQPLSPPPEPLSRVPPAWTYGIVGALLCLMLVKAKGPSNPAVPASPTSSIVQVPSPPGPAAHPHGQVATNSYSRSPAPLVAALGRAAEVNPAGTRSLPSPKASPVSPLSGRHSPSLANGPSYPTYHRQARPDVSRQSPQATTPEAPSSAHRSAASPSPPASVTDGEDGFERGRWRSIDPSMMEGSPILPGTRTVSGVRGSGASGDPVETLCFCETTAVPGDGLNRQLRSCLRPPGWSVEGVEESGTLWILRRSSARAVLTIYRDEQQRKTFLVFLSRRPCSTSREVEDSLTGVSKDYNWQ